MAIENDIVLIYLEDSPVFFARVESIWPDVKRDWFNIEMLMLQIPLKVIVWTLKDDYINGGEFFMDGKRVRMEVVEAPDDPFEMEDPEEKEDGEAYHNGSNGAPTPLRRPKPAARRSAETPSQSTDDKSAQDEKIDPDEKRGGRVISFADFQNRKKED